MKIKPTFDKSYIVRIMRGMDRQSVELVETSGPEILNMIVSLFGTRIEHPMSRASKSYTKITVQELDNIRKTSHSVKFVYTKKNKDTEIAYSIVSGLSPREVRLAIEKEVRDKETVKIY